MTAVPIRLFPGDDLKKRIDQLAWERGWRAACLITCVGSLDEAMIRYADSEDITRVPGPLEILTLSGTIASFGGSHLHIVVADNQGRVTGGHLKEGSVVRTTAELIIGSLDGFSFHREIDPETGFAELVVGPA